MNNFKIDKSKLEKWHFHNNKVDSDYLFNLVKTGEKTATSYLYLFEEDLQINQPYSIITNFDKTEEILIKTTKIYKTKFKNVTRRHAFKEGEGNKTLNYYKKVHEEFFIKECENLNLTFNENSEIVCEEFEIVKI